jgi:acetolactate synthase-1/3 small subunit
MSEKNNRQKHIISVLVQNKFGVLSRVSGLFSGRGYNIESLSVAPTEDISLSRMTIVTSGSQEILEQIYKQLNKLIDVIKVVDITGEKHVDREMVLVKVRADASVRGDIIRAADIFNSNIVDASSKTCTIEITGDGGKIQAFLDLMNSFGILEIARTGKVTISKGPKTLRSGRRGKF